MLRLVAAGRTNDQAAAELFMSGRTVQAHLTSIYRKLNAANRAQAVRIALDHRVV